MKAMAVAAKAQADRLAAMEAETAREGEQAWEAKRGEARKGIRVRATILGLAPILMCNGGGGAWGVCCVVCWV